MAAGCSAHAALAEVLVGQPYRRTWHRAQSITGPDDMPAARAGGFALISSGRHPRPSTRCSSSSTRPVRPTISGKRFSGVLFLAEAAVRASRDDARAVIAGIERVAESRLPLRLAQAAFDLIGARSWAEQARADLRASGERTAAPAPGAAARVLSAQERQIARLAAGGLPIAERLYLSPRTVGSHLYRIFLELDITSRAQLAGRLDSV
jgi:DNA-binding CsgD family transcriptional regulator